MQKMSLGLFILLVFSTANAQKFEPGKVSVAELQQQSHPSDPSAVAAVLYTKGKTYFELSPADGFYSLTEVEVRIKIYKKEGYGCGNRTIAYYTGANDDQSVSISKAATYNLVNGQIEKTKLKSEGEFTEKLDRNTSLRKIAMPNIREGSIVEYSYTIKSPYLQKFPDWDFQARIPVDYSEYQILIPEYFKYNSYLKGKLEPKTETSSRQRDFTGVANETVNQRGGFVRNRYDYEIKCMELSTSYLLTNIPAFKEEDYTDNIENYTSSLIHELASVHFKDGPFTNYTTDWESVTRKIYSYPDFGIELAKTGYFEDDLKPIVLGDDYNKLSAIFNFLTTRMTWNGDYSYLCDKGVKKAYAEKSGNTAEINLMLVAMLRHAGLDANAVLLSTKSNGIASYPNLKGFNHVIASVKMPTGIVLMDATSKFATPGVLPQEDLNRSGRMVLDGGGSAIVALMPTEPSKMTCNLVAEMDAEGKISGKIRQQYTDYKAMGFRESYHNIQTDVYLQHLEDKLGGITITEYNANEKEVFKPVTETYSFSDSGSTEIIGGKLYFSPMLFFASKVNPLKQETREYPVNFSFPSQGKYNIIIKIPEGYQVETIPAAASVVMDEKLGSFKYNVTQSGGQLQLFYSFDIGKAIVGSEYYEVLQDFYKAAIEKQNEKIVLKKV
jgi:transglutaminase-like putative cysteine protease